MNNFGRTLNVISNYSVKFLIEQLEKNKKAHIEDHAKAVSVWKKDIDNLLKKIVKEAKKEIGKYNNKKELTDVYEEYFSLCEPVNAEKTYDTYISLLNNTTSEHISLSIQDANAIINDEWDWAIAAKTTNASYSSRF